MNNFNVFVFEPLLGRTIVKIEGAEKDSEEILFTLENGDIFRMYHEQDCCEDVRVEDVGGDINRLIGNPLLWQKRLQMKEKLNTVIHALGHGIILPLSKVM